MTWHSANWHFGKLYRRADIVRSIWLAHDTLDNPDIDMPRRTLCERAIRDLSGLLLSEEEDGSVGGMTRG